MVVAATVLGLLVAAAVCVCIKHETSRCWCLAFVRGGSDGGLSDFVSGGVFGFRRCLFTAVSS
jgi:hypothetical protein